jgi:two-component system, cell cycle sensor histidine kinase and response regulator CckA
VIKGYSEIMLSQVDETSTFYPQLQEIKNAATRAGGFSRQLLTFGRQQVLSPKLIELNEVIQSMQGFLKQLVGEDIAVSYSLDPELGRIMADPSQIEQVVMNLVVNARDAIRIKGEIAIETANVSDESVPGTGERNRFVRLTVRDNGCGINEEVRSRMFEPFFTTKELGKGTGLGLSTVYGVVRQSNGFINVESVVGEGATFQIMFPCADALPVEDGFGPEGAFIIRNS